MHYDGANSYLYVNGKEIQKFTAKHSIIVPNNSCSEKISKDWSKDNIRKTGFNGYIYDFSTDYNVIATSDIIEIHKYLIKNNGIV